MKKSYFLGIATLLATSAQSQQINNSIPLPEENVETSKDSGFEKDFFKKNTKNTKAFGDTLFYEDFSGGLPAGWRIFNNNANNFAWEWNTVYQQGQFSTTRNAIKSTTAANGFMSLPSDFYNTPTPTTGRVPMDTYFESDTITITPKSAVWVSFQQYVRYCCSSANRLVLQVSTDGFATTPNTAGTNTFEYDAINGLPVNAGNTSDAVGGQTNVINISTAVAGHSKFQIRFVADHSGRYFWMIDDFAVIEGPENDLELTDPYMEFHETNYTYYPFYGQIPYHLFPPLPFFGRIYNNGSNTLTNVRLEATVNHTAYPNGSPGLGLVYSTSMNTFPSSMVSGSVSDSVVPVLTGNPRFVPTVLGDFQVDFLATSDSIDQNLGNESAVAAFSTSDTVFARDDNGFGGGTGPASYVRNGQTGGTAPGDRFATMYIVESSKGNNSNCNIPTSISYFVTDDVRNIGVEIVPKIWAFNDDSLFINGGSFSVDRAFGSEVASSFIPYTVTAADTNRFLTLPLDNGSATINGLDSGQYAVGWDVTSVAGGTTFEVANDATSAAITSSVTSYVYMGHDPGWGWVAVNPVIRLNFGKTCPVGIKENQNAIAQFEVMPNPSTGEFKVVIQSEKEVNYALEVRNTLGQLIQTEDISISGAYSKTINLEKLEKGVYYINLVNDTEKLVKRVILN